MQKLPHIYVVNANTDIEGYVNINGKNLPPFESAPPAEFDGPGDKWSPETLFTASVVDCFILTFSAIAKASSFEWHSINCVGECLVDIVDGRMRFNDILIKALLNVPSDTNIDRAYRLLEKAEKSCLVTNSLVVETRLNAEVKTV